MPDAIKLCQGDTVKVDPRCSVLTLTDDQLTLHVHSVNGEYVSLVTNPYRSGRIKQVPLSSVTLLWRGNWYNYQNGLQLSSMSYADEIAFWRDQKPQPLAVELENPADGKTDSWTIEQAIAALKSGVADAFVQSDFLRDKSTHRMLVGFRINNRKVAKRLRQLSLQELTHLRVN